jgi:hypothetical protein
MKIKEIRQIKRKRKSNAMETSMASFSRGRIKFEKEKKKLMIKMK